MANIAEWKTAYPLCQTASDPNGVTPQEVLETLSDLTNDDAIICTDVASIRCGRRSSTASAIRASLSVRAAWVRWASDWARRSAHRWPTRTRA